MGGGSNSGKPGASEALSLVFRIATVGLSLASAITTAASTQSQCVHEDCNGEATATVSFGNYNSFKYSALADLLSAVLQGVAICLEVARKEKAAKVVELIDKLLMALTSTSAALLLAVDDITSCGSPRGGGRRRSRRFCTQAGRFCGKIRASSALSLVAAVSVSVTVYTRHIPVSFTLTPRTSTSAAGIPKNGGTTAPPPKNGGTTAPPPNNGGTTAPTRTKSGEEQPSCTEIGTPPCCGCPTLTIPQGCEIAERVVSPPCCGCPRRTIPQGCQNPEPCGALCVYAHE
ncbi:CASP-like protein 1U1 [Triticum dicoccoides]|uniref:CASP-like protein 1U1 n=1 Tax=Triticum dicoccoides TaxID=85692 RepID=UPI0018910C27|nr:CASP-like protein 1U1 [Triticum dicoccoides]